VKSLPQPSFLPALSVGTLLAHPSILIIFSLQFGFGQFLMGGVVILDV
jgi:hypothetical protein